LIFQLITNCVMLNQPSDQCAVLLGAELKISAQLRLIIIASLTFEFEK